MVHSKKLVTSNITSAACQFTSEQWWETSLLDDGVSADVGIFTMPGGSRAWSVEQPLRGKTFFEGDVDVKGVRKVTGGVNNTAIVVKESDTGTLDFMLVTFHPDTGDFSTKEFSLARDPGPDAPPRAWGISGMIAISNGKHSLFHSAEQAEMYLFVRGMPFEDTLRYGERPIRCDLKITMTAIIGVLLPPSSAPTPPFRAALSHPDHQCFALTFRTIGRNVNSLGGDAVPRRGSRFFLASTTP